MNPSNRFSKIITWLSTKLQCFVEWSKQSWRGIAIGAAFVFVASIALFVYAIFAPHKGGFDSVDSDALSGDNAMHETCFERILDGVCVSSTQEVALLPMAVMVENSSEAWPLSGVSDANVIFEAPVEGSITRYMLMFDPSATSTKIGPVRSARPYYVNIAEGFGALYAHVGGSPDALSQIKSSDCLWNVDEFSYGKKGFWRSEDRYAPHNTYTSIEALNTIAVEKNFSTSSFSTWLYSDSIPEFAKNYVEDVQVPYLGRYRAHWVYDPQTKLYTRYQNGIAERDSDTDVVRASTVVIALTDAEVLDDYGRLALRTEGTGSVLVFRDGTVQEGIWKREKNENFSFESVDGRDLFLSRGKIWISILTEQDAFDRVLLQSNSEF